MTGARLVRRILIYAILVVASVFFPLPVYLLVITSLKSYSEVKLASMWTPLIHLSLESFREAWLGNPTKGMQGLSGNFWNSMKLVIPGTIVATLVGSVNG
jgi:glucose/mannose transport system permease protein